MRTQCSIDISDIADISFIGAQPIKPLEIRNELVFVPSGFWAEPENQLSFSNQ